MSLSFPTLPFLGIAFLGAVSKDGHPAFFRSTGWNRLIISSLYITPLKKNVWCSVLFFFKAESFLLFKKETRQWQANSNSLWDSWPCFFFHVPLPFHISRNDDAVLVISLHSFLTSMTSSYVLKPLDVIVTLTKPFFLDARLNDQPEFPHINGP